MARIPVVVVAAAVAACSPPPAREAVTVGGVRATLAPFGFTVGGGATTTGGPGCAPLTLALRADSDSGAWHKPEAPTGDEVWLHSGDATVAQARGPGALVVDMLDDDGKKVSTARLTLRQAEDGWVNLDVAFDEDEVDVAFAGTCLRLQEGEHLVGGGERFDGPDLRGRVTPAYFDAPGEFDSGTNEAHAPVPFFASSAGYAVLVDEERVGAFDVGVSDEKATIVRFHGNALHLALRPSYGGEHASTGAPRPIVDAVAALARRMGLPPAPPSWVLAPMQWRNDVDADVDVDGNVVRSGTDKLLADAAEMRTRGIPTSTIWIDAPWETGYNTFAFNEAQLPGIHDAIAQLEAQGFHVITWATDNLNTSDDSGEAFGMPAFASKPIFDQFAQDGLLVADAGGGAFTFPWGRGTGGFVDFTNDDACAAYRALMRPLIAGGVRGFKLDYGETMRPDLLGLFPNDVPRFFDGTTTATEQTRFSRLYHECYLAELEAQWPGNDHFVITRTGGIYDQKNGTAIWPGDLDSGFEVHGAPYTSSPDDTSKAVGGLPAAVGGYLSLAMSAYPLYGSDVGGYRQGMPTPEAFVRWAQFGAVSTVMQVGGGGNQAAWDPELVDVVDAFTQAARLHMDLMPMFARWLAQESEDGTPVAVPVGAIDGSDAAWADADTFVLGVKSARDAVADSVDGDPSPVGTLLAAPVVADGARTRTLFVPAGTWWSWWDDSVVQGPGLQTVDAPLERLPLFVREDAIMVLSDPRLLTTLDNGDAPGGGDDMGQSFVARIVATSASPRSDTSLEVGDVRVRRRVLAGVSGATLVEVDAGGPGEVIVDLHTPGVTAPDVSLDPAHQPVRVTDEAALLSCTGLQTCLLVEPGRVRAASKFGLTLDVDLP